MLSHRLGFLSLLIIQWVLFFGQNTFASVRKPITKIQSEAISTIRYVKTNGTGDGSSWASASGDIQAIINASAAGDQIWIAKGVYQPAANTSFRLSKNLHIYGGFPDTGTPDMTSRDKGNLAVLKANGADLLINSSAVTQATLFDGLTFTGAQNKSAMVNDGASPLVTGCIFKDNSAVNGAGVFNRLTSKAIFTRCVFQNNSASGKGGAMLNTADADITVSNCVFVSNSAPYGPGIITQSRSKTLVLNSTFYGNGGRGALTLEDNSTVNIYNTILWGADEEGISRYSNSVFQISYSVSRTGAGGNVLNTDPLFADAGNPEGADEIWGTADDGLRLQMNSPMINAGDPLTNTESYTAQAGTSDFNGNSRVFDTRTDMGAYEYLRKKQSLPLPGTPIGSIYYIDGTYGSSDIPLPQTNSTLGNVKFSVPSNNGRVIIADGKIRIIAAGLTTLTLSAEGDENYDPITKTMTIRIGKKSLRLAPNPADPLTKIYDGSDYIYLNTGANFVFTGALPGDEVYPKFSSVMAYFDSHEAGKRSYLTQDGGMITVAGASAANYSIRAYGALDNVENPGTILPKPIIITAKASTKVFGGSDPELSYTLATGSLIGQDKISGTLSRDTGETAGIYAIRQNTLTAGSNYSITFQTADFTITKAKPVLTEFADISKVFGEASFDLPQPVSNSDGEFNYSSTDEFVAGIEGKRVSLHNAGVVTLVAVQAETTNFLADTIALVLTVAKADPKLVFKVDGQKRDGADNPATAAFGDVKTFSLETNSDASPESYNFDLLEDYRDPYIDFSTLPYIKAIKVGTSYVEVTVPETANFYEVKARLKLVISPKTIKVTAIPLTKVYGETDPELSFTVSPALEGEDSFSGSLSRVAGEDAGTYGINQNTLTAGSNYLITYEGADFTISPKIISVKADPKTKVFGTPDPELTYTIIGSLQGSDSFSGKLSRAMGENAGAYNINQGTLALTDNYTIDFTGEIMTVDKAVVLISGDAIQTFTYDGKAKPVSVSTGVPDISGLNFRYSNSAAAPTNAGSYAVEVSLENENYRATSVKISLVIEKAKAGITLSNLTQMADGSPKMVTALTSPANLQGLTITYNGSATPPVAGGNYTVIARLNNPNYTAADATGILQVEAVLPVSVTNFAVKRNNDQAEITWKTTTEKENAMFIIERSADGINFSKLGSIQGAGTSASARDYRFYDNMPVNGLNYYRLSQVDNDGQINLIGIQSLNFVIHKAASVNAFPIPLRDNDLSIRLENYSGKQLTVKLTDLNGKLIHTEIIKLVNGDSACKLALIEKPAQGMYLLHVEGEGLERLMKLIVH